MSWTEQDYEFPQIDAGAESYFEDCDDAGADAVYAYGFSKLPELRALMRERLAGAMSEREMLEAAKLAFKNKPAEDAVPVPTDRDVVDFVYQLL